MFTGWASKDKVLFPCGDTRASSGCRRVLFGVEVRSGESTKKKGLGRTFSMYHVPYMVHSSSSSSLILRSRGGFFLV